MQELKTTLREAYEEAGYEVEDITINRKRFEIAIRDAEASGEQLREITYETVDEAEVLGFNVTTESTASDEINTVVSFRYRG
jgi:8-oxo-dGTP pyrophosphatase MutT (NUDIX family)